jgi:hypothetical protein
MQNSVSILLLAMSLTMYLMWKIRTAQPKPVYVTNIVEANLINWMDTIVFTPREPIEVITECKIIQGLLKSEIWVRTVGDLQCIGHYYSNDIGFCEEMFIGKSMFVAKEMITDLTLHYLRQLI